MAKTPTPAAVQEKKNAPTLSFLTKPERML